VAPHEARGWLGLEPPVVQEMSMIYEIPIESTIYVSVEHGGADAAARLARDHVANGWLLRETEGTARDAGAFVLKGLSAAVGIARPFLGNRRVTGAPELEEAVDALY
jgi:hypothetical protein